MPKESKSKSSQRASPYDNEPSLKFGYIFDKEELEDAITKFFVKKNITVYASYSRTGLLQMNPEAEDEPNREEEEEEDDPSSDGDDSSNNQSSNNHNGVVALDEKDSNRQENSNNDNDEVVVEEEGGNSEHPWIWSGDYYTLEDLKDDMEALTSYNSELMFKIERPNWKLRDNQTELAIEETMEGDMNLEGLVCIQLKDNYLVCLDKYNSGDNNFMRQHWRDCEVNEYGTKRPLNLMDDERKELNKFAALIGRQSKKANWYMIDM